MYKAEVLVMLRRLKEDELSVDHIVLNCHREKSNTVIQRNTFLL